MKSLFARMFTPAAKNPDGLTQAQREAIVDLLHFCMHADDKALRVEERMISLESVRFRWEGPVPYEVFAAASFDRAQRAVLSFDARARCISDIATRLVSTVAKQAALSLCQRLFLADRDYPDSEQVIFREIRLGFGGPAPTGRN